MRILTIVLNALLLLYIGYMLTKHGVPKGEDLIFATLFTIVPIFNIAAMWNFQGDDWISLFLQRKALEEKRKIDELTKHK